MTTAHLSGKRRKPKRKPVTLITGIVCKDGIVVASDSQTTWGSGKSWDASKMTELVHPYGRALVAESGAVITSQRIVEHLQRLAKDKALFDQHKLPGLAQMAVYEVRKELRAQNFECSSEELEKVIERNELAATILIAHNEDTPKIDTVSFSIPIPQRTRRFFAAEGTGADLASYILTENGAPDMDCTDGALLAIYTIEAAKRHDPYCGGPTKLGIYRILEQDSALPVGQVSGLPQYNAYDEHGMWFTPIILSREQTEELVALVLKAESINKENHKNVMRGMFDEHAEKKAREFVENLYPDVRLDPPDKPAP